MEEEQTYRDGIRQRFEAQDDRMKGFETDMRNWMQTLNVTVESGFKAVHKRQDKTNGRVRWTEKMIYLAVGGLGVLSIIVIPLLLALIQNGKI